MEKDITEKQADFLRSLGITFTVNMTRREASETIRIALAERCRNFVGSFVVGEEVFHKIRKCRCIIAAIRPVTEIHHLDRNHFTIVLPDGKRQTVHANMVKKIIRLGGVVV